jgi:outer membrane protein insertion porin family
MGRTVRTLILGMILVGMAATPLISQATQQQYRVGNVKIVGSTQISPDFIQSVIGLVPGQVYSDSRLRNGFDSLKRIYGTAGYLNFTAIPVQDIDEQKKLVNLTINIDEDRHFAIRHISFTGNATTDIDLIRRKLLVQEGQTFNASLWELSLSRLNQLGYFEEIRNEDVAIRMSTTEPTLDINVTVKEKGRK